MNIFEFEIIVIMVINALIVVMIFDKIIKKTTMFTHISSEFLKIE